MRCNSLLLWVLRFKITYEELKLNNLYKTGLTGKGFKITYEELKLRISRYVFIVISRFKITYEELKYRLPSCCQCA